MQTLCKSYSAEVRRLEQSKNYSNIKIQHHQRKVVLKEQNKDLAAALQDKRSKSRPTIQQLLDDAEQVMMEALGIQQAWCRPGWAKKLHD